MSNIIQLLERMGQEANLQKQDTLEQAIKKADLKQSLKESLLNKDKLALERQLDICPDIVAFLFPAEDEQPQKEEEDKETKEEIRSVING
ncbi:hypothetical protein SG34_018145 [Thalassomonas viridans]|uniref:Uncharacterized protein n=1 Tax=Thalassomonas viridans TaxID=137584 RepID=A0AAF0C7Y3_9GAMM|nr:hypothetical protein [Thalassomonas viridans]WDE03314.1 hypothetical protein SG34_018145 [Thalassomonas viridans]